METVSLKTSVIKTLK